MSNTTQTWKPIGVWREWSSVRPSEIPIFFKITGAYPKLVANINVVCINDDSWKVENTVEGIQLLIEKEGERS